MRCCALICGRVVANISEFINEKARWFERLVLRWECALLVLKWLVLMWQQLFLVSKYERVLLFWSGLFQQANTRQLFFCGIVRCRSSRVLCRVLIFKCCMVLILSFCTWYRSYRGATYSSPLLTKSQNKYKNRRTSTEWELIAQTDNTVVRWEPYKNT